MDRSQQQQAQQQERELNQLLARSLYLTEQKYHSLNQAQKKEIKQHEISRYNHLIYELALVLKGAPDNYGYTPTLIELIDIIDACFSANPFKQEALGFEYFLLINASKEKAEQMVTTGATNNLHGYNQQPNMSATIHAIRAERVPDTTGFILELYNANRERFKTIANNRAIQIIREKNYQKIQNKITTDEKTRHLVMFPLLLQAKVEEELTKKIKTDLPPRVQLLLHETAKKTCTLFHQRYFANIIALNTFMKFWAVVLMQETKAGKYIFSEPGLLYFIGGLIYGDIFSNAITKTKWKEKAYYLSFTLISVVGAALAAPLTETEPNFWHRLWKAFAVFVAVTGFHAIEILLPIHKKLFNKSWWYIDNYQYQVGGPVCPGRIFMASALPIIMRATSSIFDYSGYNITSNNLKNFIHWAISALVTQTFQNIYFQIKLPRYAKECEVNQALPKWDPIQLYSYTKNYTVRSRQSENIWTTSAIIFLSEVSFNLISIYPESKWLPIVLAPCVLLLGSRLGTFFQREVFTRMEVPKSVSKNHIDYLHQSRYQLGMESSSISKLEKLQNRKSQYPQTLPEKIQQVEVTAQTGNQIITFGERNLFASITTIALYYVLMHYFFDRAINTFTEDSDNFKRGTWGFFGLHLILATFVHAALRISQYLITRFEMTIFLAFEITGFITRGARFLKTAYQTQEWSKAVQAGSENVFIIDHTKPRVAMDSSADKLKKIGHNSVIPSPLDTVLPDEELGEVDVQISAPLSPPPPTLPPVASMAVETVYATPWRPRAPTGAAAPNYSTRPVHSIYQGFQHVVPEVTSDGTERFVAEYMPEPIPWSPH